MKAAKFRTWILRPFRFSFVLDHIKKREKILKISIPIKWNQRTRSDQVIASIFFFIGLLHMFTFEKICRELFYSELKKPVLILRYIKHTICLHNVLGRLSPKWVKMESSDKIKGRPTHMFEHHKTHRLAV